MAFQLEIKMEKSYIYINKSACEMLNTTEEEVIGEMPLHLQAKLLRVIESKTITRIGSNKKRTAEELDISRNKVCRLLK